MSEIDKKIEARELASIEEAFGKLDNEVENLHGYSAEALFKAGWLAHAERMNLEKRIASRIYERQTSDQEMVTSDQNLVGSVTYKIGSDKQGG